MLLNLKMLHKVVYKGTEIPKEYRYIALCTSITGGRILLGSYVPLDCKVGDVIETSWEGCVLKVVVDTISIYAPDLYLPCGHTFYTVDEHHFDTQTRLRARLTQKMHEGAFERKQCAHCGSTQLQMLNSQASGQETQVHTMCKHCELKWVSVFTFSGKAEQFAYVKDVDISNLVDVDLLQAFPETI